MRRTVLEARMDCADVGKRAALARATIAAVAVAEHVLVTHRSDECTASGKPAVTDAHRPLDGAGRSVLDGATSHHVEGIGLGHDAQLQATVVPGNAGCLEGATTVPRESDDGIRSYDILLE